MTRLEWLTKKHKELDTRVTALEAERDKHRSFEHKALLTDLKKQRLQVKAELTSLQTV